MIISGAAAVTMNPRLGVLEPAWLRIEEGAIREIDATPIAAEPGEQELDAGGLVLLPGFVNTHTHLFQTLIRGVYEELPFRDWLSRIYACGAALTAEDARIAAMLGGLESLRSGVTTLVDHQFLNRGTELADATIAGLRQIGLRTVLARTIMDLGGVAPREALETPEEGLESVEQLFRSHADELGDGMLTLMTGPNTPGVSGSGALALATLELARRLGIGQSMHLNESVAVIDAVRCEHGATGAVDWLDRLGALGGRVLAAHCVHLHPAEIAALSRHGVAVSHNAVSNGVLGDGIAPVTELLEAGVVVALGTDGAASNNSQDMFEVMKTAVILQRARRLDATVLSQMRALRMATIDGARALGLDHWVGSLEVGKRADLIGLDLVGNSHTVPVHNLVSQLVFCARPSNVRLVVVDGRVLMRRGEVLVLDEPDFLSHAQHAGAALVRRLESRRDGIAH